MSLSFLSTRVSFFPSRPNLQEELFLNGLGLTLQEFEPKANNCTEVDVTVSGFKPSSNISIIEAYYFYIISHIIDSVLGIGMAY